VSEVEKFPELSTKRLRLRELRESDAPVLLSIFSNPHTMRYYGSEKMTGIEEIEGMLMSFKQGFEKKQAIRFGIELKETGELIGTCGVHNWAKRVNRIEMGYELNQEKEGNGYMSEALTAMIPFAFQQMNIHRIGALIHPNNESSRKLVQNLGFREEGVLRDYVYAGGEYMDLIMYSILIKEWYTA